MMAVPHYLGQKFVYSRVNAFVPSALIKKALGLLCQARICTRVPSTAANVLPLGAEVLDKYQKIIFLDVGLCFSLLGLSLDKLASIEELNFINSGGITEQVVGQLLRTLFPFYEEPSLYYWHRAEKGSTAEIDYVIQHGTEIIPIEVKAGTTGTLKSLHYFMNLKKKTRAVRINSNVPLKSNITHKDPQGKPIEYQLYSLPFYLIGQLHRLLSEA